MNSDGLSVGDRMKRYEQVFCRELPRRIPVIIRVDGRAFHTITRRRYGRTWSEEFVSQMVETTRMVMAEMQGCNLAYSQSDEINFLLTDYRTIQTEPWFGYDLAKIISISASLTTAIFSHLHGAPGTVSFDSRAFSVPQDDVCNYFIWRQIDATRNAIQFAAREHFSHKQLHGLNCNQLQELLFQEREINFNDYPTIRKRGFCVVDGVCDYEIPIFTENRNYIEEYVYVRQD